MPAVLIVLHEEEAIPEGTIGPVPSGSGSLRPVGVTAGAGAPIAKTLPALSDGVNVGAVVS